MTISFLFLALSVSPAFADKTPECGVGRHWVRAHHSNAYTRADGTPVSASEVPSHCQTNPPSFAKWSEKLKRGMPPKWIEKSEKISAWTPEERERILDALGNLPSELLRDSVDGIYRLKRSAPYDKNPASGVRGEIAVYDPAFAEKQNLSRILGHELAHELFNNLNTPEKDLYRELADWTLSKTPSGDYILVPTRPRDAYVKMTAKRILPRTLPIILNTSYSIPRHS